MSHLNDIEKIINKITLKELNGLDTTEDFCKLNEMYFDELERHGIILPTEEEINAQEQALAESLIGGPLSPFYIEFCNQMIFALKTVNEKIQELWSLVKKNPNEIETVLAFQTQIENYGLLADLLCDKLVEVHGTEEYVDYGEEIDNFINNIDLSYVVYTASKDYISLLDDNVAFCGLLVRDLEKVLSKPGHEKTINMWNYCFYVYHIVELTNSFVELLKKELA